MPVGCNERAMLERRVYKYIEGDVGGKYVCVFCIYIGVNVYRNERENMRGSYCGTAAKGRFNATSTLSLLHLRLRNVYQPIWHYYPSRTVAPVAK